MYAVLRKLYLSLSKFMHSMWGSAYEINDVKEVRLWRTRKR